MLCKTSNNKMDFERYIMKQITVSNKTEFERAPNLKHVLFSNLKLKKIISEITVKIKYKIH